METDYIITIDNKHPNIDGSYRVKKTQELTRCKDCKYRSEEMYDYYHNPNDKRYVCQINDVAKKPDWFCADGERREDDA